MLASPLSHASLSTRRSSGPQSPAELAAGAEIPLLALILGLLTVGETRIDGLAASEDVLATAEACRSLGAVIGRSGSEGWRVHGVGVGGVLSPQGGLDFGGSALSAMLIMAVVASHGITAIFDGKEALRARAMTPVLAPLTRMGAEIVAATEGTRLPLTLRGALDPVPILHRLAEDALPASGQAPVDPAKAAVLLAGLNAPGETTVIAAQAADDPVIELFRLFGAVIATSPEDGQARRIVLQGRPTLKPAIVTVPPPREPSISS